ncbi:hypothetical protein K9B32_16400 [Rhizobium sp. 3T7]|uniref:ankyrin repeat domain-containing protein n=1 Tax=Rhizobium sp. 3T7 TaxID=2874922 RepID=UPI001CCAEC80|nr:ankyrin repeat domain-containing protein [Rhizobium sp. 3T7]MBZ9791687.1 hypothetical protein [Rhizobium sp. 3T7]
MTRESRGIVLLVGLAVALATAAAADDVFAQETTDSLFAAVSSRDAGAVDAALEAGADPNARGAQGSTPLLLAVAGNDVKAAESLLAMGADACGMDADDKLPLQVSSNGAMFDLLKAATLRKMNACVTRCDELAAGGGSDDNPKGVWGVHDVDLKKNATEAVAECQAMADLFPQERRLIYQLGRSLHWARRYDESTRRLKQAVALGSRSAILDLAEHYRVGVGADHEPAYRTDFGKALSLLRGVLKNNPEDTFSLISIGAMYEHGNGVPADRKKARRYYEQARALGDGIGDFFIAYMEADAPAAQRILNVLKRGRHRESGWFQLSGGTYPTGVISRVQAALARNGFPTGGENGVFGPKSVAALEAYEASLR